jgi:hypothetical protein
MNTLLELLTFLRQSTFHELLRKRTTRSSAKLGVQMQQC